MFNENIIKKEFDRNGYILIDANLNQIINLKQLQKNL